MGILPKIFERIELFHAMQFLSGAFVKSFYCQVTSYVKSKSFHFYYFRSCLFTFPNDIVVLFWFFLYVSSY